MTKTFKAGEYGFSPFYKLTTTKSGVKVTELNAQKEIIGSQMFSFNAITNLEMYLWDQTSAFFADKMLNWLKGTKEYKSRPVSKDPFTTFSFIN